jgi:hypothetical protein
LESKYYQDPDSCDLSELMVVENIVSGRKEIVTLFWENKLGIDVDVCILPSKCLPVITTGARITFLYFTLQNLDGSQMVGPSVFSGVSTCVKFVDSLSCTTDS